MAIVLKCSTAADACASLIDEASKCWREVEGNYRDDITAIVCKLPFVTRTTGAAAAAEPAAAANPAVTATTAVNGENLNGSGRSFTVKVSARFASHSRRRVHVRRRRRARARPTCLLSMRQFALIDDVASLARVVATVCAAGRICASGSRRACAPQ